MLHRQGRMWEREERTLEGVVESAAAFWEEVNCDEEKSGWLEGIILSVVRWALLVGPRARPRRPALLAVAAQLASFGAGRRAGAGSEELGGCGRDARVELLAVGSFLSFRPACWAFSVWWADLLGLFFLTFSFNLFSSLFIDR